MELKLSILTNINISLSDYRAGQSNVIMTISFDTTDQIPPKGIIELTYPSQFLFQSGNMQGKFLAGYVGNSSSLQVSKNSATKSTLDIHLASNQSVNRNGSPSLEIKYITNPSYVDNFDSFQLKTYSENRKS